MPHSQDTYHSYRGGHSVPGEQMLETYTAPRHELGPPQRRIRAAGAPRDQMREASTIPIPGSRPQHRVHTAEVPRNQVRVVPTIPLHEPQPQRRVQLAEALRSQVREASMLPLYEPQPHRRVRPAEAPRDQMLETYSMPRSEPQPQRRVPIAEAPRNQGRDIEYVSRPALGPLHVPEAPGRPITAPAAPVALPQTQEQMSTIQARLRKRLLKERTPRHLRRFNSDKGPRIHPHENPKHARFWCSDDGLVQSHVPNPAITFEGFLKPHEHTTMDQWEYHQSKRGNAKRYWDKFVQKVTKPFRNTRQADPGQE
ncbi:hypothetical protein BU16DRAFT_537036 [Lophium mytilinum]|uniref:Uncharacterized protein n=1 Tax=Lophium mytilinum TaxID=390894 RepID=A0A6A6QZ49_9PEZI|nr:hypothetical protein BU16DRAFT_537036 [Lophium mytilinum]